MREQPDLTEEFELAISKHGYGGGNIDRIETRTCASDNHDGREYDFFGPYIPIRPIINVATEQDEFAIEEISFVDESTETNHLEPHLSVFIADLRQEQPHPAFTEARL